LGVNKKNINKNSQKMIYQNGTIGFYKVFLNKHFKNTIVLENPNEETTVIVSPELQGRVMTSGFSGDKGMSFGWINHELISSKERNEQFNAFGGEERFWLGPEGGQFSLYFSEGAPFEFSNWKVPTVIDSEVFDIISKSATNVVFNKSTSLKRP
jgi:hypothetical protein